MKVSTRGRYALRMMIDIAENKNSKCVSIKEISERQGISIKYLEQIVTHLKRAGLLRGERGTGGGYRLTKSPNQYTVGEILRSMEGKLTPIACLDDDTNQCERCNYCQTLGFWQGLYKVIDNYVDSVTLQDLIEPK